MKVLVIDDDPNAQRILKLLLQRSGCEPLVCSDEAAGLQIATGDDAPHVIICDWRIPGISAPAFCKKLRAAKPRMRPYVFILSTKQTKEEMVEALDAGADDYVAKPFNLIEMQARLRVAARLISYQRDLLRETDELSTVAERNKLLGEILSKQQSAKISSVMQSAAAAVSSATQAVKPVKTGEFSQYEIRFIVSAALLELKLALESAKTRMVPPSLRNAGLCAWSSLLLKREQLWIDLMLSGEVSDAAALFERSLSRRPGSYSETFAFMTELSRMVCGGFQRTLQMKDPETVFPMSSKTVQPALSGIMPLMGPEVKSHELIIEGKPFNLTIATCPSPRQEVELGSLRELDYLAESIPPSSVSEIPLFKKGTIMTSRFVYKVHEQSELTHFDYQASVHRPSAFSKFFTNL